MEPRKVIKFGNSSYVVTLPYEWVLKNKLEKGSTVNIIENDSCLLVSLNKDKKENIIELSIDNKPLKLFNRELISCYLKNFEYIKIVGKDIMERLEEIRVLNEKLSSIEIVEINPDFILLKDLTNPSDLDVKSTVFKIIEMEKVLFDELIKEDKKKSYFLITTLDKNINKLTFLSYKALNYNLSALYNVKQAKNSIHYWRIVSAFESIGDIIKRISRYLKNETNEHNHYITDALVEVKEFFQFVTNLLNEGVKLENNLKLHLDKKQSLLRELEGLRGKLQDDLNLYLVITQLFKDIIGQLEEVVLSVIDLNQHN
ncbi:MAG: hypothetical protein KC589_00875 [Nanoarchaeota archaeon]|nr:hypothetical protein [Nanoarchaeota archaeon]